MCCGGRRSAWRAGAGALPKHAPAPRTLAAPPPLAAPDAQLQASADAGPFPSVSLRRNGGPIRVAGPVTGRLYAFTQTQPVQAVDLRDAAVLTRSASFRQL